MSWGLPPMPPRDASRRPRSDMIRSASSATVVEILLSRSSQPFTLGSLLFSYRTALWETSSNTTLLPRS